ncbi:MAG: hypothetical protein DIZ80_03705 [endosymbiont of Galathealinum brachiosum]|uniref:histidine kinase n=1 Tax=endosymbiont of Galathealinum brachiosum TaxID=2200906 RepID=A0A370DIB2_9GAMM|nr:MAG: hypothetical protein DIZ80_03705 [endosymbiont of Galathealinum brachiosum]
MNIETVKEQQDVQYIYLTGSDELIIENIIKLLQQDNFIVNVFSNLSEMKQACEYKMPACLVIEKDFKEDKEILNEISGINNRFKSCLPIVLISQNNTMKTRLASARAGVSRFFCKPLDCEKFLLTIIELTDQLNVNPYRVLCIDDNELMLEFYESVLKEANIECEMLSKPLQALDVLEKFNPDIIVMDIQMPECLGSELAQVIRQDDTWAQMPIIFLSSEVDLGNQLAAMNLGGDFFLSKPVSVDHFLAAVNARVKRARQIYQLNKNLQHVLRENKFQLATMDEHDIVSCTDVTGKITNVNDLFCEISGYSREELLGQNHRLLKSGLHPDSFYKEMWKTVSEGEIWRGTICNHKKNGEEYWVDSTIVPFLDNKGKPYKYVSARTNVTELRKSEERLNRSQQFSKIGTWDWDITTGELFWSDLIWPLFGYEKELIETTYENFLAAVHPDDRQNVIDAVNNCVEKGSEYNIEHRVIWADGSERWVQESGDVVRSVDGKPLHMLGVVQDINTRKKAELDLQEREKQLREAQSIARIGNWKANVISGELVWSDEIYRIFGYEPGSIKPSVEAFKKAVHPDDLAKLEESEKQAQQTGLHDVIHRIILSDDSVRYVHELAQAETDEAGNLINLTGTVQDITDRIESEEKLHETEERFAFAVEGAGDGVWDWDMQSNSMQFSETYMKMIGYTKNELAHKLDTWVKMVHPDDMARIQKSLQDYLQGRSENYSVELRLQCKQGNYIWVLCRGTVVSRDQGNRPLRMIGIHSDITERVELLDKLSLQKSLVDRLHHSATSFVEKSDFRKTMNGMLNTLLLLTESDYGFIAEVLTDDKGQYLKTHAITNIAWNDETQLLYENSIEDGIEFRNLNNLFGHILISREVVISNDPANDSRSTGLPEGHPVMSSFMGVPVFYGNELIGVYAIANRENGYDKEIQSFLRPFDITYGAIIHSKRMMELESENRKVIIDAKEEAENANRAKSQFLSSMSHELRTPLNAIMGFSQLLKMEQLNESQNENVNEITKAGGHLLELINEVLDLSKIEAGRIELSMDSIIIEEAISESFQLITPLAQKRGIEISIEHNGTEISFDQMINLQHAVRADHSRLRQVLLNLLSNAVKYNNENGKIIINYENSESNLIRVSITDTGYGLSTDQQGQLFKAFNRLGAEQTEVEGSGIGLVITKNIIELMGGNIGMSSAEGSGSTFWVELKSDELKINVDDLQDDSKLLKNEVENIMKHKYTVLYIEDNPANLRLVNQLLSRRSNIHMWSAPEPLLGLELAAEHKPDLILLDINLPGMDGYEVLKQLKLREITRNIPVIAISANAMPRDIEKGAKAGFDDYITKPINVTTLLETVDKKLSETIND